MHVPRSAWILFVLVCCLACGGETEAQRVQRYLAATDRSLEDICKVGTELETLKDDLMARVKGDYSKAHLVKIATAQEPRLQELALRFSSLVSELRSREAPESCKAYHEALIQMLDPFEKAVGAYTRLTLEMKRGRGFSMTTFGGLAGEILRSVETARTAARHSHEERQKVLDEFGIQVGPDGLVPEVK